MLLKCCDPTRRITKRIETSYHTKIPSDVEVNHKFTMDYYIALFIDPEEMVVPIDEALEKITKKLDEIKIFLENEITNPIAIICTHRGKQ